MDSPRGRIFLIKSLAEGRIALTDSTVRASRPLPRLPRLRDGVPVRRALRPAHRGRARRDRAAAPGRARAPRLFRWVNFSLLLAAPARCWRSPPPGLRFYQVERAAAAGARVAGCSGSCPGRSPRGSRCCRRCRRRPTARRCPSVTPADGRRGAPASGCSTGCIQQVAFGPQNRATARVLARNGAEVRGAARPGLLRRAPRPRRRARDRARPRAADHRGLRGGAASSA